MSLTARSCERAVTGHHQLTGLGRPLEREPRNNMVMVADASRRRQRISRPGCAGRQVDIASDPVTGVSHFAPRQTIGPGYDGFRCQLGVYRFSRVERVLVAVDSERRGAGGGHAHGSVSRIAGAASRRPVKPACRECRSVMWAPYNHDRLHPAPAPAAVSASLNATADLAPQLALGPVAMPLLSISSKRNKLVASNTCLATTGVVVADETPILHD